MTVGEFTDRVERAPNWLPSGKTAAVIWSLDDVHPGRSGDAYEAGGDLGEGALGWVEWLFERHPELRATLFVTPDWRQISPFPTRRLLARIPLLRDRFYLAPVLPKGTMRLDRHPDLVRYLNRLERAEVALHGLHHVHRGLKLSTEFQDQNRATVKAMLREGLSIFETAGLDYVRGLGPPTWNLSPAVVAAAKELEFSFVSSARDLDTEIAPSARTAGSGLRDAPLIFPGHLAPGVVHFPVNFQATSSEERAMSILDAGGLLSIKAHVIKNAMGHVALDGLDETYAHQLDRLFGEIERRYGGRVWWTSMGEVATRLRTARGADLAGAAL